MDEVGGSRFEWIFEEVVETYLSYDGVMAEKMANRSDEVYEGARVRETVESIELQKL